MNKSFLQRLELLDFLAVFVGLLGAGLLVVAYLYEPAGCLRCQGDHSRCGAFPDLAGSYRTLAFSLLGFSLAFAAWSKYRRYAASLLKRPQL